MREVKEVQAFIQVFPGSEQLLYRMLHSLIPSSQHAHPWFNASGGRDHIWPFTTDWAACVAPLSNFAHSIHLVSSGDVAPRARWYVTSPHSPYQHMNTLTRLRLQVQRTGARSHGQF